jgi:hypothetical protein
MRRKVVDVIDMVDEQAEHTASLRQRMDEDYDLWSMAPYDNEELAGFRKYTPNEARTQANKVISLLSSAKLLMQINQVDQPRDKRDIRNAAERFYIGVFAANDERLSRMGMSSLDEALSWYIAMRGFYAGRNLLTKTDSIYESGTPNIHPWDPRNCYWEFGAKGLTWFAHKTWRTSRQIKNEFGINTTRDSQNGDGKDKTPVIEWYDDEHTGIIVNEKAYKKPTPHGSPEFPCFFGAVGPSPLIYSSSDQDTIKDWGESIYQSNRGVYDEMAFTQSIRSEFMSRSLKIPYVIKSPDGTLTLDENPWLTEGGTTGISLPEGAEIIVLDSLRMAQEAGLQVGELAGQVQRGGIPWSSFGTIQDPISGFAIGQLRQGQQTPIEGPVAAKKAAYVQITRALRAQYGSGAFQEMTVSGREQTGERTPFNEVVPPEVVRDGGDPDITITPELPQDDVQAIAMALQLSEPGSDGEPLVDYRTIREKWLRLQDADRVGDAVLEQRARRASEVAAAHDMMLAAINAGDEQLAMVWFGEAKKAMLKEFAELQILQMQAAGLAQARASAAPGGAPGGAPGLNGGGGTGTPAGPPRFDPRVAPNATIGVPPQMGPGQQGPLVPPGTPRPGRFGQFGPNGVPGGI